MLSRCKDEVAIVTRDPRYDVLFEQVRIGPVTAKNRFYQVPHCNGSGSVFPHTQAAMRGMKAAGGWGVVNTEWCSIHPTSDTPAAGASRMWSDEDVRTNLMLTEAVHRHGALAGCELAHAGLTAHNHFSRMNVMGPSPRPLPRQDFPGNGRAMSKDDIRDLRKWHRQAVARCIQAEFDIVYLYVSHGITVFTDFLSPRINTRTDEYGGKIENRVRLLRETLDDVSDAAAGRCAVALRFCVDEHRGATAITAEDGRAVIEMLAEMPDLWDVNVGGPDDMLTSRFRKEGWQEPGIAFVKKVTSKPVVGVGRFTSPDTMVSMIRRGILDLIGCARPSIADPFLPKKIEEGRPDDIRECIGCNICLASNQLSVPIRCTQNPTMSEEWRRGWHPEIIPPTPRSARVLVVGAGPAGLEAARAAGARGYDVTLAEAGRELGGHLNQVTRLPGLSEWIRVRDWRVGQLQKMNNVEIFRESRLDAEAIVELGHDHVVLATGSSWRRDGVGLTNYVPIPGHDQSHVVTPDDVLSGATPASPVVIFDDDSYFMGGALAELLARRSCDVTIVVASSHISPWTQFTFEHSEIHKRLVSLGVRIVLNSNLSRIGADTVEICGLFGESVRQLPAAGVVLVTMRMPNDALYHDLQALASTAQGAMASINTVGDCRTPGLIAEAVFSGHSAARNLDAEDDGGLPFRVEQVPASFEPPLPGQGRPQGT